MTARELFNKYNGQTVGTNDSDYGECVGWYNMGIREQLGLGGYVIQGAYGAKDLLTASNTRPDLIEQVRNNPSDMNQKPSEGDWVIWGGNLPGSGGYGHVGLVLSTPPGYIVTADQNWGGKTVHEVKHDWSYVIGWIHHRVPAPIEPPVDPCAELKNQLDSANATIACLNTQVADLTSKNQELGKVIDNQSKEIESLTKENANLTKQLEACKSDSDQLNKLGEALRWIISRLGLKG